MISEAPIATPTPMPAFAPLERLSDEDESTTSPGAVKSAGAQTAVPESWVHLRVVSQQPSPSSQRDWPVVHPSSTGVTSGGRVEVMVATHRSAEQAWS